MSITIREATPRDVDDILGIAESGWRAAYGDFLSPETIDRAMSEWYDPARTEETIERDDVCYLVAETGRAVRGYVSGGPGEDDEDTALLGAIYVDPEYWGEGIGTALLSEFEAFCRAEGYERIEFDVLAENEVGQSFYRARGYEEIGERETELFGETVRETRFRGPVE